MANNAFFNKSNVLSATKALVVFKSLAQLLGALAFIFLARILSPENYGIYGAILSLFVLISGVASFGIGNTLLRYLPEYISNKQYTLAKLLFFICCKIRFLSLVLGFTLLFVFKDSAFALLNLPYSDGLFVLIFVYAISHFQVQLTNLALYSFLKVKLANINQIVLVLVKLVGYSWAYMQHLELLPILVIDIIAYWCCLVFVLWFWRKELSPLTGDIKQFEQPEKKRLLRYALFYNFNDVGGAFLGKDLANLVLLKYLDPLAVAVHTLSYRLADMMLKYSPIKYFSELIRPLLFTLNPVDDKEKIKLYFSLLNKLALLIEIPLLAVTIVLSSVILTLAGGEYYASYGYVLSLVLFASIIASSGIVIGYIAQLYERSDIVFYSKFTALLNVFLSVGLVQHYGISGVVIATAISAFIKNLFIWCFVRQSAAYSAILWFLVKLLPLWAGFTIVMLFLLTSFNSLALIVVVLISALIVFYLGFKLKLFTQEEKAFINNHSTKRISQVMQWLNV